jgi:hypothetical protein
MKSWQPVNSTRAQNDKRFEGGNRDKESGNVHRRDDLILLRWPSEFNWQRRTKKITFTELWAQERRAGQSAPGDSNNDNPAARPKGNYHTCKEAFSKTEAI